MDIQSWEEEQKEDYRQEMEQNDVERMLTSIGLPPHLVDIFMKEGCTDLDAFMYLEPEDLVELSERWPEAQLSINDSNEILSGVHEMKVASEDAWQEGVTANGESYVYNTVTMATRWEKPSTSYRDNPPRWIGGFPPTSWIGGRPTWLRRVTEEGTFRVAGATLEEEEPVRHVDSWWIKDFSQPSDNVDDAQGGFQVAEVEDSEEDQDYEEGGYHEGEGEYDENYDSGLDNVDLGTLYLNK